MAEEKKHPLKDLEEKIEEKIEEHKEKKHEKEASGGRKEILDKLTDAEKAAVIKQGEDWREN